MGDRFKGKAVVVTGAGRGIGRAIAEAFAEEGASVVVNDPGVAASGTDATSAVADEVVADIAKAGGTAMADYGSVADWNSAKNMIDNCVKQFGKIDILVAVAGILRDRMLHKMSQEEWDSVLGVHLNGTFNCIRHAAPYMREQGSGRIITFTSAGWLGTMGQANYSAAKGGIVSLTRTCALELGALGITTNCIAPGAKTRMTLSPEVVAGMKKKLEAGALSKENYEAYVNMPGPEFVAPIVLYLSTDEAANVNGKVFGAAGGSIFLYSDPVPIKSAYKFGEKWTLDELIEVMPKSVTGGLVNPAQVKKA